jgi:hypothetical protein
MALATMPAASAEARNQRQLIMMSEDHSLSSADDCEHFHTQNVTSYPATAHDEEERNVPLAGVEQLKVRTSEQGGISVRGWDRPVARLTVCKYAVGLTQPQADRSLLNVNVSVRNGEIAASGPAIDHDNVWWVHMILRVPRSANVDVLSANGGIAIRNMMGRVTARATNGGILLASCSGENRVSTGNGGISLDKVSGHTEATALNGPIALKLHRELPMPSIEAQVDDDGHIVCNVKGCESALAAGGKRLRIGSAAPSIRLSTGRAPITIEQVR